jgi:cytochrome c-type biogenesis protein CcmF
MAGIAALVTLALVWAWARGGSALAPLMIGLAVFVIFGALTDLIERVQLFRIPFSISLRRARGLPRSTYGTALAHLGLGVALIGIVCETTWNSEHIANMAVGDSARVGGYTATFEGITQQQGPNFREQVAKFNITRDGTQIGVMTPSKRGFSTRGTSTTEAALMTRGGVSQLYISLGDAHADGSIAVRMYYKPLVLLIWFGPVLMALGGVLSLSDRRLRVGAPKPAKSPRALQPAE